MTDTNRAKKCRILLMVSSFLSCCWFVVCRVAVLVEDFAVFSRVAVACCCLFCLMCFIEVWLVSYSGVTVFCVAVAAVLVFGAKIMTKSNKIRQCAV